MKCINHTCTQYDKDSSNKCKQWSPEESESLALCALEMAANRISSMTAREKHITAERDLLKKMLIKIMKFTTGFIR